MLGAKGARSVSMEYEGGEPVAIYFAIEVKGNPINFRLPSNYQGVFAALKRHTKVPKSHKTIEQAKRVSWRIVKDWVEAQLAIIESGQAELAEVFMPYAVTISGETLYKRLANEPRLLLGYEPKELEQ